MKRPQILKKNHTFSVTSKQVGDFFQFLCPSQKTLTLRKYVIHVLICNSFFSHTYCFSYEQFDYDIEITRKIRKEIFSCTYVPIIFLVV